MAFANCPCPLDARSFQLGLYFSLHLFEFPSLEGKFILVGHASFLHSMAWATVLNAETRLRWQRQSRDAHLLLNRSSRALASCSTGLPKSVSEVNRPVPFILHLVERPIINN